MNEIKVGDTIRCPDCGDRVTATVDRFSNLTYLEGSRACVDGSMRHPWPGDDRFENPRDADLSF